jgi:hypothetical protein
MVIGDREVPFAKVPTMVVACSTISKGRHRYFAFLIQEDCNYFKAYLEDRMARGERQDHNSPISHEPRAWKH